MANELDAITVATRNYIARSGHKLIDSTFQGDPFMNWVRGELSVEEESDPFLDYAQEVLRMAELEGSVQGS